MPVHVIYRGARPSGRVLLLRIRSRFTKATRQKALRDRVRSVAADLIGRPTAGTFPPADG